MKASVIIPNLNGAGWLRDSIESIWAQTEQDFELIVIDNGSTDESLEIARSYCGRDRYTLIENAENTGFSHAVNQGIALAKGEDMALVNNDAFAEPTWLTELLRTAEADPKIFAVSSLMLRFYEPELADDAGDYVTILGFACKRGDGLKASRYTKPCRIFSACGGAALYRKSILDKIGVFAELFFAYYEDVGLSWTEQHPAALQEPAVGDDAAEPDPDGAGVSAESGDVPVPWVRQRLCEGIPRSLGGPAEAEQAEVPLEKPAQLHLGRVQFNCRPVSLPHLPHPARAEGDLICSFS